jgi:hypothetical protein
MWIFLNDSFLSIVADRERPDGLRVRARIAGDIERVFPHAKVEDRGGTADYRFCAVLPRRTVGLLLCGAVRTIDYPNFKESVKDPDRHRVYANVWAVMRQFANRWLALGELCFGVDRGRDATSGIECEAHGYLDCDVCDS